MEEAYTIGIRLALDDGVSAGIAAIAADLAALERAMAVSSLGSVGARAAEARRVERPAEPAGELPQAPMHEDARLRESIAAPGPVPPQREREEPGGEGGRVARPVMAAPVVLAPAVAPVVSEITGGADAVPAAAPAVKASPVIRVMSPMVMPEVQTTQAALGVSLNAPVVAREIAAAPVMPAVTEVAEAPRALAPAAPAAPAVREVGGRAVGMAAPAMPSVAPPSVSQGNAGPTQGDVYLDGVRMGRWMASTLAREASRPQGGTTHFDPRMGPSWPGTLQGG
jgi:hypothetical protein